MRHQLESSEKQNMFSIFYTALPFVFMDSITSLRLQGRHNIYTFTDTLTHIVFPTGVSLNRLGEG